MRAVKGHVTLLAATALALGLAACSSMEGPNALLTQQEAQSVADVVVADAASLADAASYNAASGVPMASAPASATTADHSRRVRFTDFTRTVTKLLYSKTTSIELNGVRTFTGTADALEHSETNFRTDYTYADGSTATHLKTWSSTFTADVPGSIQFGSPLPSGSWNIAGTSTWTRGDRTYSLSVTTNPPLHYKADCTVAPKFNAGTISAVVTRSSGMTTITVQFTACGQYTVTRS